MRIEGSDARVEGGAVRFKVPHRRPGHPFVVRADRYHVVVIGTQFGVAVNGDRRVDVDVDEGVVEVWNNDVRLARLEPGQRWNSAPESDDATAARARAPAAKLGDAADKSTEKFELPRPMPPEKAPPSPGPETTPAARVRRHTAAVRSAHGERQVAMLGTPRASPPPRHRPRRAPRWPPAMRRARWRSARPSRRSPGRRRERRLRDRSDPEREAASRRRRSRPGGAIAPTTRTEFCASRRTCRSSRRWRAPGNPTMR